MLTLNVCWVLKIAVFYIWDHIIKLVVDEHLFGGWLLREVSKYGVFSGPYFPGFSSNTGKYGPEKNSVLTFHAAACYDLKTMICILLHFTSRYNIVSITRRNHIVHAFFAVQYIVLKHEQNIEEY